MNHINHISNYVSVSFDKLFSGNKHRDFSCDFCEKLSIILFLLIHKFNYAEIIEYKENGYWHPRLGLYDRNKYGFCSEECLNLYILAK